MMLFPKLRIYSYLMHLQSYTGCLIGSEEATIMCISQGMQGRSGTRYISVVKWLLVTILAGAQHSGTAPKL